jgi:hypothetical protein
MKLSNTRTAVFAAFKLAILSSILVAGSSQRALAQDAAALDGECKSYVQKFYDYYVKESGHDSKASLDVRALKNKSFSFSPELNSKIMADNAAASKSPGEIVGLDFDPFLNSQENPGKYVAEKVSHKGDRYLVTVYQINGGKKESKPAVTPELEYKNKHWTFVNFHYVGNEPANENLLSILKILKAERRHK